LLEVTRHANKLRIGHLEGNRFRIRLVGMQPEARAAAPVLCQRVAEQGIGNYFGSQRFGLGQRNLETALTLLERRRLGPRAGQRGKFLASVIQSEIFNRYLILRSERGRGRLLAGDVVRLQGSRAVFVVEDPEREAPRLAAGDIHLTGPLVGPKMKQSEGEPLELERAALASVGLDETGLRELGRSAPGTRRDLLLRPEALSWRFEGSDGSSSGGNGSGGNGSGGSGSGGSGSGGSGSGGNGSGGSGSEGAGVVEFGLPAGAYASLVIRALTRQDPWAGAQPEADEREERSEEERTSEGAEHDPV
jgi:tRNA(Glu) U13 pseudouridine synthase TruD